MDRAKLASVVIAGVAMVALSGEALAQAMIVRSSGPSAASNKAGTRLPARTRLELQANDSVTIIASGKTRQLKGPGSFVIGTTGAPQGEAVDRLASYITRTGSANRVRAGAVRGGPDLAPDGPIPAPSLWFVEGGSSGPFCYAADRRVIMWRELPGEEEQAIIAPIEGGDPVMATWGESSRVKSWPDDEAPLGGATYTVTWPGSAEPHEISFVALDTLPEDDPQAAAEVLIANGCMGQLDRLIAAGADETEGEG